jgi:hypothetical protein
MIADGKGQSEAYKATVGNIKATSAQVKSKASNLAKKYAELIQLERQKISDVIEQAKNNTLSKIEEKDIITKAERMELLSKMAKGELKVKQPFVIAGKIMEYPSEPSLTDRRNAIAELNKMCGDYAPQKTDITTEGKSINQPPLSTEHITKLIDKL